MCALSKKMPFINELVDRASLALVSLVYSIEIDLDLCTADRVLPLPLSFVTTASAALSVTGSSGLSTAADICTTDFFADKIIVKCTPTGSTTTQTARSMRQIERACKQCHVMIHGSNSPSGWAFIR